VRISAGGTKVLVLHDTGTAIRRAIDMIRVAGREVVGVVQCLDRQATGEEKRTL
jgi:orotate phosphoribosyltransferase